ncbi:cytochrome b5-like Heme/Steroid binding domain protein [Ostertagia ostertagi]
MAGKPWRLKPALYTTSLVYISIQVAFSFLSFLCSYYGYGLSNLTRWTIDRLEELRVTRGKLAWLGESWRGARSSMKIQKRKATQIIREPEIKLEEEMQILNAEQLSLFDGTRPSRPVYLAILGRIYNVEKGRKHYGKGGGYHFFAGRDATRAFVSGDFTESGLVDNTDGLSHDDLLGIRDRISFYEKDYKLVGVLVGRYYDANGQPTQELRDVLGRMQTAAEWKASRAAEAERRAGVVFHMKSGGIQRDWAGVPRLLYDPNTKQQRCACVKNFGAANRGDLDHPNLRQYPKCSPSSNSCRIEND